MEHQLDEAALRLLHPGLGVAVHHIFPRKGGDALGLGLVRGDAYAGDLRVRIHAGRHHIGVDGRRLAGDPLHAGQGLGLGGMGQLHLAVAVPHPVDAGDAALIPGVHLDEAPLHGGGAALGKQAVGIGPAAHADQHPVAKGRCLALFGGEATA